MRVIDEDRFIDLLELYRAPFLQVVFDRYQLGLIVYSLSTYSLALVREFYASYHATGSLTMK